LNALKLPCKIRRRDVIFKRILKPSRNNFKNKLGKKLMQLSERLRDFVLWKLHELRLK
jgi:hypothetical protein